MDGARAHLGARLTTGKAELTPRDPWSPPHNWPSSTTVQYWAAIVTIVGGLVLAYRLVRQGG